MLTGMVTPTAGYALVDGLDIRTNMSEIRNNIGICLQHDCLFPQLTVYEHIVFFARLKGMYERYTAAEVAEKVIQSIEDVALLEKMDTWSSNLSGGMKRKLSVAIAFCGDSKTVLLDEPTSGMDPFSRRFTWNVIRQYRQDRCIILVGSTQVCVRKPSLLLTSHFIVRFRRHILWTVRALSATLFKFHWRCLIAIILKTLSVQRLISLEIESALWPKDNLDAPEVLFS
jgi:ABC-type transporter Mla maintaining outer membrane lipid asymmetry ATPase subunit MlaF